MQNGRGARCAAFETMHPAVPAVYVVATLALTMFSMQPVLIALSLVGGLAYDFASRGAAATLGALRWQLPIILIIAVLNPLFSASGSTELIRLGERAVYLESLAYGACMGGMFVASILWFEAAGSMLSYEKVMSLLGNAAPVLTLMISMCMRLIPQFARRGRTVLAVQDAIVPGRGAGIASTGAAAAGADGALGVAGAISRTAGDAAGPLGDAARGAGKDEPSTLGIRRDLVARRLRASSVLMGWSMEDSLERADAMRARGWGGAGRRTTYMRYRFCARDGAALAVLLLGAAAACAIAAAATSRFTFYPQLSPVAPWWGYALYAAWMLMPCALYTLDKRRFG